MPQEKLIVIEKLLPGIIGSAGALLWLNGSLKRRVSMVVLGSCASYWGAPHVAAVTGMSSELAGFLVGLFGMSIVDSIFVTWSELHISAILKEFIRVKLRLPKE